MNNLLTVSAIALGLALATTCANAQTAPKAKAAAKAPNHEAMMKPCRASTKDMYTGDQRVFTYGYCVSKLPHAGNQVAGRQRAPPQARRRPAGPRCRPAGAIPSCHGRFVGGSRVYSQFIRATARSEA